MWRQQKPSLDWIGMIQVIGNIVRISNLVMKPLNVFIACDYWACVHALCIFLQSLHLIFYEQINRISRDTCMVVSWLTLSYLKYNAQQSLRFIHCLSFLFVYLVNYIRLSAKCYLHTYIVGFLSNSRLSL